MDYSEKRLMGDDCLKMLKFISCDIFQSKPAKFVLSLLLVSQITFTFLTIYAVLFEITLNEFKNYAPVFFGTFQGIIGLWTLFFKNDLLESFSNNLDLWSLDSAGPQIKERLLFEVKIIKAFVVFNMILTMATCGLFAQPLPADLTTFYMLYFFKTRCPNYQFVLEVLYRMSYVFLGYAMTVHAYQFIYATQHGRFQIILYGQHVENIARPESENLKEADMFYDESYQKTVKDRLKFCVMRHQEFLKVHSAQISLLKNLIVAFSISGCMLGISLVFYILTDQFTVDYYPRVGISCLTACSTFNAMIYAGQSIESQSDDVYIKVNTVEWYNFNQPNKATFGIMLQNMMQPWKIQFSENYSVNYELGRAIVQGIYSIMSVMVNWL